MNRVVRFQFLCVCLSTIFLLSKVNKLQNEIDKESVNRAELARMERELTDPKQRDMIRSRIEKSDDKIQSLALLMLHYCAGLQHCLDQQEEGRQQSLQAASGVSSNGPANQPGDSATDGGISPIPIGQDAVDSVWDDNTAVASTSTASNSEPPPVKQDRSSTSGPSTSGEGNGRLPSTTSQRKDSTKSNSRI